MSSPNPDKCKCWGNVMPTQILLDIFARLTPKALIKCRETCTRWKFIVDDLILNDHLWQEHYETEYRNIHKSAKLKTRPGITWFHIYRSLSLWSKLSGVQEIRDELVSAPTIDQEIRDFQILKDGVIAVHTKGSIIYYDLDTLQRSNKEPITGEYIKYAENEYAIVTSSYQQLLFVVRKVTSNSKSKTQVTFSDIRTFMLVNQKVYYANLNNEIYICNLREEDMTTKFIEKFDEKILCFGFTNQVHVLTAQHNIYTIVDQNLFLSCSLNTTSNLLHYLNIYGLLEDLDWRIYLNWVYVLNQNVPTALLKDVVVIRSYGDVFFVGSNWGVLSVYYAPYTSGELNLFNLEPVKQYDFNNSDDSSLAMCPILQIDVLEAENGHTVVVAMPKKIVVLNIIHDFT